MNTIKAKLEALNPTDLRIDESPDDARLRGPVLTLMSGDEPLVCVSGFGSHRRRQRAETTLDLFKSLIEQGAADDSDAISIPEDEMETTHQLLHNYRTALEEILGADITSAAKAKAVAERVLASE